MTSKSFQERHRDWLGALVSPPVLERVVDRATCRAGWQVRPGGYDIDWGRIDRPGSRRAQLVLRSTIERDVLLTLDVGDPAGDQDPDLGPVSIRRFPDDPRLPQLQRVLDKHAGAELIRYRPEKRCTLRVGGPRPLFVKVFAKDDVGRVHADCLAVWQAWLSGELGFAVAESIGYERETSTQVQSVVAGRPVIEDLYAVGGETLARRLGRACASLPKSSISPTVQLDATAELARTQRRAAEVVAFVPELSADVDHLLVALERLHHRFAAAEPRPIHGSPHPTQWLGEGDRLGLVDFDRFSWGDPELDVATFCAEAGFEAIPNAKELNAAFLDGYAGRYGTLDPQRLTAYLAHKRFAKVYRTVRSLRVDADRRAAVHLERTVEALKEGVAP